MKKLTCCVYLLVICLSTVGQMARRPVTALYNNLNAYSGKGVDALSFSTNGAALAHINGVSGGVYGEQRFLLNELSLYNIAFVVPTGSGNFGITANYVGSSHNNEVQAGLAYGRKLSDKIAIGVGFNHFNVRVQGYGSASAVNFEGGILLSISEQLSAGLHAYNPTSSPLGKGEAEFLPSIYTAGLGYTPSDKFFIAASLQKVEDEEPDFNAGVHYKFDKKLGARAGFASASGTFYLGLGYQLEFFKLDITGTVHPQLGVTPGLQLLFTKKAAKR